MNQGRESRVGAFALTADERAQFHNDGFIIVPKALTASQRNAVEEVARNHDELFRERADTGPYNVLNEHDLVGQEPVWMELVDNPAVLAKVVALMGWNIQLFHTQLLVTPPAPAGATPGPYGWHQDNNRMNRDFDTTLHPMVSLKVGYFITALSAPGMGNLCVAPGSHRMAQGEALVQTGEQAGEHPGEFPAFRGSASWPQAEPPTTVEVLAEPGDAIIFDRRIWHSASTNTSTITRIFATYGYSYRWLRPKSAMNFGADLAAFAPVCRQLLGWATSANGYFDPLDEDVPLRAWVREHFGEDAVRS